MLQRLWGKARDSRGIISQSDLTKNATVSTVVFGTPELDAKQRTYVIVGNGRGGTSMVAGAAAALGVSITPDKRSVNYEDADFVQTAQGLGRDGTKLETTRDQDIAALREAIARRNAAHDLWGWKDPSADLYIKDIVADLRSPHFIFVWRDAAAVATAQIALQPQLDPLQAIAGPIGRLNRYWNILSELKRPTLMISYERAKMKPLALANELAAFVGKSVDATTAGVIQRFVSPNGGYRELS